MATVIGSERRELRSREPMRARYPDAEGYVERDGVRSFYEVYGDGEPTLLLLPTWSLVHSRFWKAQIPYLARHFRVVTFDGRGNGRSDRPVGPEHYGPPELAADALAVLDATATERAITVSESAGTLWNLVLCANHAERVSAAIFIGALFPDGEEWPAWTQANLLERQDGYEGAERYNVHHIREDLGDFAQWWGEQVCAEPHSTMPIEYLVDWALDSDGERIADTLGPVEALGLPTMGDVFSAGRDTLVAMANGVRCPTLVLHGELDPVTPPSWGAAIARETGGRLHPLPDTAHGTGRKPVEINLAMRDFTRELTEGETRRDPTLHHGGDGRPRALFICSPIGLGHARRDLAIARELRSLAPEVQIDWLTQDPVTRMLSAEGESIHPASVHLANESSHFECESSEHDLHCFQTFRRMDEVLINNFMVFHDVVEQGAHDLWIADEGWDVDYYLHENPSLKKSPYAWLTDFVGFLPVEEADERERFLTADYNAEMVEHIAAHPDLRDRAVFVGNLDDIVDEPLGPDLPLIRDWTEENYAFAGYVTGNDPASLPDRGPLRAELGYAPDERVCVVTVGGSGVGADLLRHVIAAYPEAKRGAPDLRMIVVAGPRIDPDSLPYLDGLEVLPYVHDLYKHLAACDLAVVQGGLTTAMELTAGRRPFLYFPLKHHFEQRIHVAHRLDRYGAGRRMEYDDSPPDAIAEAIVDELGRKVDYRPVESDGARRAAEHLAELLR